MKRLSRLRTHKAVRYTWLAAAIAAAILAVTIVATLTVDLGPAVRLLAEHEASRQLQRPVHLGPLRILVVRGVVEVRDITIDGLQRGDRPFFTAKRLLVSLDWSKVLRRRPEIVITSVELTDWDMLVEKWSFGDNFPKLPRSESPSNGPRPYAVTLGYLRAWRGHFSYLDHESPWSVVAPDIDLNITKRAGYEGDATLHGGLVSIQQFVPMWANMRARFVIDGSILHMKRVELESDGAKTVAIGDVDLSRFPEMTYAVTSHLKSPRMREIFFAHETWPLTGEADFKGTFHLFRGGHDMTGTFSTPEFGVYDYRFPQLSGSLHWTNRLLDISDGNAKFFGGAARFVFSIKPIGTPAPSTHRFEVTYANADLARVTDFEQLTGQRFTGSASGRNVLEWRSGGDGRYGDGEIVVSAPAGVETMTGSLAAARAADGDHALHEWGPFAPTGLAPYLPIAAEMHYHYDPAGVVVESGRFASESTFVTFQGSTAWGGQARMPFHITSRDWQESDELLAGILSDFGSRKRPVPVGGRGEFDGVLTGPFSNPRVEGRVVGEDVRAWDTNWGEGDAHIVVQNDYVTVSDGIVRKDGSEIHADGRFALGYPRADHGEEIDARFRANGRDLVSLRHAFQIDAYPVTGDLSGEFHLTGLYQHVVGFGAMTIDRGIAYGEPFEHAEASLRFDGNGVRLDGATMRKGTGSVDGAAYVGWDSTYSFNADARRIPMSSVTLVSYEAAPPGGLLEFTAGGSGNFDVPRYDVRFRINDLSVGGEPVGQAAGTFGVRGRDVRGEFDVASPTLSATGTGRITLTPQGDSDVTVRFHDLLLQPYLRLLSPSFSAANRAVASGSLRIGGNLSDWDRVAVDGTVDALELQLFDPAPARDAPVRPYYTIAMASPVKLILDRHILRVQDMQLVGGDGETHLQIGGTLNLTDERLALQATGDANLSVLQAFPALKDVRGSGRAELMAAVDGPMREPNLSGSARIVNGRIRHFALPNALDNINGSIQFDSRGVRLDGLTAAMGEGAVQFGGRIGLEGYLPGDLNVTMVAEGMHLRVPEGVRSTVDADLAIRGNVRSPTLAGSVIVRNATFTQRLDPTVDLFGFASNLFSAGRSSATSPGVIEAEVTTPIPLRYEVELIAPSALHIDNNVARLVASANLQLRGTYDRPQLFGHAEIDRGDVTLQARRYVITRGSIDFTNPTRIEPFVDVEAETRVRVPGQTYRVTVQATGTRTSLAPIFSSDPPLPQADVLTLLFSDVGARASDANQAGLGDVEVKALQNPNARQTGIISTQLFSASRQVSDVGRVVEQTFGVDTFQLSPSLFDPSGATATGQTIGARVNPTARVTIGKRISDRVYLTYSRSLTSAISDQIILLEYDASDRYSWILSRNEDQSYALEVSVRHTF